MGNGDSKAKAATQVDMEDTSGNPSTPLPTFGNSDPINVSKARTMNVTTTSKNVTVKNSDSKTKNVVPAAAAETSAGTKTTNVVVADGDPLWVANRRAELAAAPSLKPSLENVESTMSQALAKFEIAGLPTIRNMFSLEAEGRGPQSRNCRIYDKEIVMPPLPAPQNIQQSSVRRLSESVESSSGDFFDMPSSSDEEEYMYTDLPAPKPTLRTMLKLRKTVTTGLSDEAIGQLKTATKAELMGTDSLPVVTEVSHRRLANNGVAGAASAFVLIGAVIGYFVYRRFSGKSHRSNEERDLEVGC